MAKKVGQERKVIMLFQEILGESMPEGVRMDQGRIDSIFMGIMGQAIRDSACRNPLAVPV